MRMAILLHRPVEPPLHDDLLTARVYADASPRSLGNILPSEAFGVAAAMNRERHVRHISVLTKDEGRMREARIGMQEEPIILRVVHSLAEERP